MNTNKNQPLSNFQKHGVTRSTVSFFGRETNIPTAKATPVTLMLAAFEPQRVEETLFFGRPLKQSTDIADLVNASLAHIELEPALTA